MENLRLTSVPSTPPPPIASNSSHDAKLDSILGCILALSREETIRRLGRQRLPGSQPQLQAQRQGYHFILSLGQRKPTGKKFSTEQPIPKKNIPFDTDSHHPLTTMPQKRKRTTGASSVLWMAALASATVLATGIEIGGSGLRRNHGSSGATTGKWSKAEQEQRRSRTLQSLTGSSSAKDSCNAAKAREEADIAPSGGTSSCKCEQSVLDERYAAFIDPANQPIVYRLECLDQRCSYCSPDGQTCDRFSYGAIFEEIQYRDGVAIKNGVTQVAYFETNQYVVGRPEAVVYTEYNDPSANGNHGCSMQIDGLECALCEYIECPSGDEDGDDSFYGLNVICSNIKIGDGTGNLVPANDFQTCDPGQLEAIGATQGVFEMYDPDYGQCYTSVEGCDRDTLELEQTGYYECSCKNGDLLTDGTSPFLQNVGLECTTEGLSNTLVLGGDTETDELCRSLTSDTITRTYSSYVEEDSVRTIEHKDGTVVSIRKWDCQNTGGTSERCGKCEATINGSACNSCTMNACELGAEDGVQAASIDCSNSDPGLGKIDLCLRATLAGNVFEPFGVCGFGSAKKVEEVLPPPTEAPVAPVANIPEPVSLLACNEKRLALLNRGHSIDNDYMVCECLEIDETSAIDSGTLLSCTTNGGSCGTTNGGSVCNAAYGTNEENGACFREELVQGFLPDGNLTPLTRTTTYTHGTALGNTLIGRTMALTEYDANRCDLAVDGVTCASCELRECSDPGVGLRPLVDCSNIIDHPIFYLDTCDKFPGYNEGLILRLAAGANGEANDKTNFNTCSKETLGEGPDSGAAVDPSLPTTCQGAQPIVLPEMKLDPKLARSSSNDNFSIVSFVSSTVGLAPLSPPIESCANSGGGASEDSPSLWYSLVGSGKGIRASVCRDPTNFDAVISVYAASSCDDLVCVSGSASEESTGETGSSCDTHWVAEEGTTYYIRVHGSSSAETGSFNLFLETLTNDVTELCSDENSEGTVDEACVACSKERANRIAMFDDPNDVDCRCIENDGTGGFHLTCVYVSCLKCNPRQDRCGFDTFELDIESEGGVSSLGSYESFYFMNGNGEENQANEIAIIKDQECLEMRDPYQQCMMAKEEMTGGEDSKVFCDCRGISEEGDYMLLCSIYDAHDYCSTGSSGGDEICATILFGQTISQYGAVASDFRTYNFRSGGEDRELVVDRSTDECTVTVNDQQCSSCRVIECDTGPGREDALDVSARVGAGTRAFHDLSIDCSNVFGGETATYECGSAGVGELSLLAGELSAASEAEAPSPTPPQTLPPNAFPPTLPPVTKPTLAPETPASAPPVEPNTTTLVYDEGAGGEGESSGAFGPRWSHAQTTMASAAATAVLAISLVL
ncbi:unnamed protein product [Pseudo-nitzschia multistriata]|uniref:Uncharacterized protein n=1 Tax=Pseudo-nitzschia multistriata TaxID=183589 RepID=A0A448ZGE4_9STRA|nr:unnamed protein product [Pseudo-nitzschia multistriata]